MEKPPAALLSRITNDTEKQDPLLWAFERYTNLQPHEDVLDVGCGVGRVALALSGFLTGRYEGFDVDPELIAWCQQNIALPNFGFTHVDLFNQSYNPRGAPASAFTFPYEDASFDLVFGFSLFTHLLPDELERYLGETRRVLRPSGHCLYTFFLLRPQARQILAEGGERADRLLEREQAEHSTLTDVLSEMVAYRAEYVRGAYERNGLRITDLEWGNWPAWAIDQRSDCTQDMVIAVRSRTRAV